MIWFFSLLSSSYCFLFLPNWRPIILAKVSFDWLVPVESLPVWCPELSGVFLADKSPGVASGEFTLLAVLPVTIAAACTFIIEDFYPAASLKLMFFLCFNKSCRLELEALSLANFD